ncbi:MAG: glycoside hydrolase family 2 TIM barrel-domain containing protein, partial [Bacteroidales bacterium]|nr:glycoside hydrolase family 2 TIM barrel-domain containing protein [Bacteroidales bacterium]
MKKSLLIVLIILGGFSLYAQETSSYVLQNVYARDYQTLNGSWNYIVDPFDNGYYDYRMNINRNGFFRNQKQASPSDLVEYNFDTAPCLQVPGDWNTQDDRLFFYEGSIWYKRDFNFKPQEGKRQFIYFGAVNYFCNIYLNGREIATHEGGFTPFSIEVTDRLKEGNNFLILRVNNERHAENVPTVNFDWWNYGGITRDVLLVSLPTLFVDDYQLRLKKGSYKELEGYVCLSEAQAGVELNLEIPELKVKQKVQTDEQGRAEFSIKAKPELWSPQTPKLYRVILRQGDEVIEDKIGFRQITTEGNKILLNGKQVFLSGVSIHEEAPYRQGRIFSKEESVLLLSWAKEMGCNFVRLAHYPHNEHMVRAAEEMGLMVWSEIPVYWTIAWENQATYQNASNQLRDMMNRDK